MRRQIRNFLAGILIGVGCILPGVSGGVMAVSFGLYKPMLDAVSGFFQAPKKHFVFLAPIALGGLAGMALGALGLSGVMRKNERLMLFLFTGFILGGIPDLVNEACRRDPFRLRWLWAMLLGVALALPLCMVSGAEGAVDSLSPLQAFGCGLMEGVGTVVPGISTSVVLIRLGWYAAYLKAVSTLQTGVLIWIAVGFALSAWLTLGLVKRLFDRAPGPSAYAVLGFLLVSVGCVFPGFSRAFAAECALLAVGLVCVRWMGEMTR